MVDEQKAIQDRSDMRPQSPGKKLVHVAAHERAGKPVKEYYYWRGPNGEHIPVDNAGSEQSSPDAGSPRSLRKSDKTAAMPADNALIDNEKLNTLKRASEAYTDEHKQMLQDRLLEQYSRENHHEIIPRDESVRITPDLFDKESILYAKNDPVSMDYYNALKNVSTDEELSAALDDGSGPGYIAFRAMVIHGHRYDVSKDNALRIAEQTHPGVDVNDRSFDVIDERPELFDDDDLKTVMNHGGSYAYSAYEEYAKRHSGSEYSRDDAIVNGVSDGSIPVKFPLNENHVSHSIFAHRSSDIDPQVLNAVLTKIAENGETLADVDPSIRSEESKTDAHAMFISQVGDNPKYRKSARLMAEDAARILERERDELKNEKKDSSIWDDQAKRIREEQTNLDCSTMILSYGSCKRPDALVMSRLFSIGEFKSEPDDGDFNEWMGKYMDQGPVSGDKDYNALALGCKNGWIGPERIIELARDGGFTRFFMESSCWRNIDAETKKQIRALNKKKGSKYSQY